MGTMCDDYSAAVALFDIRGEFSSPGQSLPRHGGMRYARISGDHVGGYA